MSWWGGAAETAKEPEKPAAALARDAREDEGMFWNSYYYLQDGFCDVSVATINFFGDCYEWTTDTGSAAIDAVNCAGPSQEAK